MNNFGYVQLNLSEIQYILNNWSEYSFDNNNLIEIDGYKVRILSDDDLLYQLGYNLAFQGTMWALETTDDTPNWVYDNNYTYCTRCMMI